MFHVSVCSSRDHQLRSTATVLLLLNFNLPAAAAIHTQLCPTHACTLAKVPASLALTSFPLLRADTPFRPRHSKKQNLPGARESLASRPSYHHECTTHTVIRQCRSMHADPQSSQIVWWQAISTRIPCMHRGTGPNDRGYSHKTVLQTLDTAESVCREGLCFSNVHLEPKYSVVQAAAAPHSHTMTLSVSASRCMRLCIAAGQTQSDATLFQDNSWLSKSAITNIGCVLQQSCRRTGLPRWPRSKTWVCLFPATSTLVRLHSSSRNLQVFPKLLAPVRSQ